MLLPTVPVYKSKNTAVRTLHSDHVAPSIRKKLALTSPTSGGLSVGIVRSRTQATVFVFLLPTVSWQAYLAVKHTSGTMTRLLLLSVAGSYIWGSFFDERILTHERPDLSSERAPQKDKTVTLEEKSNL
jgi:hypothetical protein